MGCGGSNTAKTSTEASVPATKVDGPKIALSVCLLSGTEIVKAELSLTAAVASLVEHAEQTGNVAISSLVSPDGSTLDTGSTIKGAGLQNGDVVTAVPLVIPPGTYKLDAHDGFITLGPDDEFRIAGDSGYVNGTFSINRFSLCAKGEWSSNAGPHRTEPNWTAEYDLRTFLDEHPHVSDETNDKPRLVRALS
mmetsp:Transcript_91657/g.163126  ORF Transcript_91657/g.163126 Transcript_91657/m.163126 type:complete len:193 (-) Transcript_91657:132-710(-)